MNPSFQVTALSAEQFAPLFHLFETELAESVTTVRAGWSRIQPTGFPCRVSLADAAVGETLILLSFTHLDAESPFRASGPIYVRENAAAATPGVDEVPPMLRSRLLSARAYCSDAMLHTADVFEGAAVAGRLRGVPRG